MNDSDVAQGVREMWKAELRSLPVIAIIALALCIVVGIWRLDQSGSASFLMGILVGALLTCALASFAFIVRLGRVIRGGPKKGLLIDAYRLARGR